MIKSKKLSAFSYKLIYSTCFIFLFSIAYLQAMEEEREEKAGRPAAKSPRIDIISPEGYITTQRLNVLASTCPKIAQPSPKIESLEDYRIACEYLNLSKNYGTLLYASAIGGCKSELIEESQRVFMGLLSYIQILQSPSCDIFQSEEDVKTLEISFYEIHYKVAQNHLLLLIPMLVSSKSQKDPYVINNHVQEIKKIKKIVSRNSTYRKLLRDELQTAQEIIPALTSLFSSQRKQQTPQPSRKLPKKIERQKTINQHAKASSHISPIFLEGSKDSFDLYFHCTADKILTEVLSLSSKRIKVEDYVNQLQKLTEEYRDLENEGVLFRAKLLGLEAPLDQINLSLEELTDLYRFFCKRYTLPQKNPIQLLENIIVSFIHANNLEGALVRTEALRILLSEEGLLSDKFFAFRASVLALNGNPSEWKLILEERRKIVESEKKQTREQNVNRVKRHLKQEEEKQEKIESEKKPQSHQIIKKSTISNDPFEYFSPPSIINLKSEYVPPREKVKTHKPSQEPANKGVPSKAKKETLDDSLANLIPIQRDYPLSKNAFKTYGKIRRGERNFSRKDLYNLFEKLNCKVEVSQGKGDHGKIAPPLNMTVKNEDGLVAVISEFTQPVNSDDIPLPLTVPNWDEKWDGKVPPYLMKSIVKALDYLGATDETVHKNNNVTSTPSF